MIHAPLVVIMRGKQYSDALRVNLREANKYKKKNTDTSKQSRADKHKRTVVQTKWHDKDK